MEKSMIKNRWIFTLCLILMTLCCLSYGVYSLIKADFSASGTIEYNAYFDLDMKAEVLGSTTTISPYYATTTYQTTAKSDSTRQQYNQNDLTDTSWKLSDLIPTDLTFGSTEEIIVKLSITNYAPYPIDIDLTQLSSDSNLYTEVNNTGYIYAYNKNVTASPADTEYITIRFTPKSSSATVKKSSVNFSFKLKFSDRFEATASELTYTTSSSTATISAYTGSKETCVLPRVLTVGSTNYTPALKGNSSTGLKTSAVTLPATTKKIIIPGTAKLGMGSFTYNKNLTDVILCYGIKNGDYGCFSGCTNLQNVYIPEGFNAEDTLDLGLYIFENCENLANVYIPNSCKISCGMFKKTGLIDAYIPYGAQLDSYAFDGCNNLTTLRISASMTSIEYSPIVRCKNIKTIKVSRLNSVYTSGTSDDYLYDKTTNTLVAGTISGNIPSSTIVIGSYAFWGYSLIQSVTIPSNVNRIDGLAFANCTSLTSATFEQQDYWIASGGNTSSGIYFQDFTSELKSGSTMANLLKEYADYKWESSPADSSFFEKLTFTAISSTSNCSVAASSTTIEGGVKIPQKVSISGTNYNVTKIGQKAFNGCSKLTSIIISKSITSVDATSGLFSGCTQLSSIKVDSNNPYFDSRDNCNAIIENYGTRAVLVAGCDKSTIPSGVTAIGSYAFYGCNTMTTISIPASVNEGIQEYAFGTCSSLSSVNILGSIEYINASAFFACSSLASITLPETLSSIGKSAFYGCTKLTSVSFDSPYCWGYGTSYTTINSANLKNRSTAATYLKSTYYNYDWTKTVNAATSYSKLTFTAISGTNNCNVKAKSSSISGTVTIPEMVKINDVNYTVTEVASDAFTQCTSITSISLPISITAIGFHAFYCCRGATSINIPSGVESIGSGAFEGAEKITSISIPAATTDIANSAFSSMNLLSSITVNSGNTVYDSRNSCNALIETATNKLIAGSNNTKIPSTVTSIDADAFTFRVNLSSITLPANLVSIGSSAFYSCTSLTSITIPASVSSIGSDAFGSCSNLSSVLFENTQGWSVRASSSVSSTSVSATYLMSTSTSATYLTSTYKSYTWTCVANSASTYSNLTFTTLTGANTCSVKAKSTSISGAITIPAVVRISNVNYVVTEVASDAFQNCLSVTSISLPLSITTIGFHAFYCCRGATSINIPYRVTSIGSGAFEGAEKITSISIPAATTDIANSAFSSMNLLSSITVDSGNTVYDSRNSCNALIKTATNTLIAGSNSTVIPSTVTSIDADAFTFRVNLSSITLPSNLVTIGSSAFYGCTSLTKIIIPSKVRSIGANAFGSCSNLSSVEFKVTTNWYAGSISLSSSALANTTTAADYLTNKYCQYAFTYGSLSAVARDLNSRLYETTNS